MDHRQRETLLGALNKATAAARLCGEALAARNKVGSIRPAEGKVFKFPIDERYVSIYPKGDRTRKDSIARHCKGSLVIASDAFLPVGIGPDARAAGELLFMPLVPHPGSKHGVLQPPSGTNKLVLGLGTVGIQYLQEVLLADAEMHVADNKPVFNSWLYN